MVKRTVGLTGHPDHLRFRLHRFWRYLTGRAWAGDYKMGIGHERDSECWRFTWTVGDVKFEQTIRPQLGAPFNMNEEDLRTTKVRVMVSLNANSSRD